MKTQENQEKSTAQGVTSTQWLDAWVSIEGYLISPWMLAIQEDDFQWWFYGKRRIAPGRKEFYNPICI